MRLKPGAKVALFVVVLALIAVGASRMGWLKPVINAIAPDKKPAGSVGKEDFKFAQATSGEEQVASGKLNRPIRVAIVLWGGYAGGIMENNGFKPNKDCAFFKDHGIQVELVEIDDFDKSRDAFRAGGDKGGVDIMWSTVDAYSLEYQNLTALNPKCIMQYDWSRGGDAIAVSNSIHTAADLKGKSISVAEQTPSHFFLLYVLAQAGLNAKDVHAVFTNSAIEAAQVFKAGKVDACVSWSPDVYNAAKERSGAHILTSTREATNLIADIFVARGDFLQKYPKETTAFIQGWLEGVDKVHADPDTSARLMSQSFAGVSQQDAEGMLADVKLPTAVENRQFFELGGSAIVNYSELYTAASNIWRKVGYLKETTRPDAASDTSFLADATDAIAKSQVAATPATQEFAFKPASAEKKQATPIVTKRMTIYFSSASYDLDANAKATLEQAAQLAQTFGSAYMRVSGNTDNVGNHDYNVDLSHKRAGSVVNYLIGKYGFPREKFVINGNGPDKPVADNSSAEGKAKNRRTDFEIVPQG